jgi:phage tail sheath protein FI
MPFQLSPGVAVVEKDFTSIVPAVATSTGAFAGTFQWGPVLDPVTINSENALVRRFGKPTNDNATSFFTAANFLAYTNNLLVVRADTNNHRNAVSAAAGTVADILISGSNSNYASASAAPAVSIGAPDVPGGIQATAHVILSGGGIDEIALSDGGSGYSVAPTITISAPSGGSGATFDVVMTGSAGNLSVDSITPILLGSGYKGTVTASFNSGNAVAGAVTILPSSIQSTIIDEPGSGYTAAPEVTVSGNADLTAEITTGGLKINNTNVWQTTYSAGGGVVGQWAAKYPGTLGNSLKVSMADSATYSAWQYKAEFDSAPSTSDYATSVSGSDDELHVIIVDADGRWSGIPGTVLEKFAFVSAASDAKKSDGTNNYYAQTISSRSQYIYWMDHPSDTANWGSSAANTIFDSMEYPKTATLVGGVDDLSPTDGDLMDAWNVFADDTQYDISLLPIGKASSTVADFVISNICEIRLDCVAFISPQNEDTGDYIIGTGSDATDQINAYRNELPSSSYAVMDSGYKYQYDRYNDIYRWVPLNGDIAGLCARTDYTNDPWFSPGGLNRGQIKNVVKLAVNPTKTDRDTLYKNGVNPVVSFPGQGVVLFGDKTLLSKPSAFDRINVRRLFIVLEKAIATASKFQLFEFNDSFTQAQFRNLVEPFLRDVQGRRGITEFVVKCDGTNNTPEIVDSNQFVADIFVKPNRSINYITLNFVAARSGISFNEIGA